MAIVNGILTFLLILACLSLIGLILIQRGQGGGLAGAFGGGGVEQAFGTHATTLAQKATVVLGCLYLLVAIVLGIRLTPAAAAPVGVIPVPAGESAPAPSPSPAAAPKAAPAARATAPASAAPATSTAPAPASKNAGK